MAVCPRCNQDRSRTHETPEGEPNQYTCVQCDIFWTEEEAPEEPQAPE
jgi:hypothetical protein